MSEANNGQQHPFTAENATLPAPAQPKPKCHNAKHCSLVKRERIVNALANGDSHRAIARSLRVSPNTVRVIAEKLEHEDVPLNVLVPVFGVSVDKALALRDDSALRIAVDHTHSHIHAHLFNQSFDEILAALSRRNAAPEETQANDQPG